MNEINIKPKIFYRLGYFGEKSFFSHYKDKYDGLVINANFAAYYKNSTGTFLKTLEKPFFVDPMTHIFARNPDFIKKGGKIRKSYKKLIEYYGNLLEKKAGKEPLIHTDFENSIVLEDFVDKIIRFQVDIIIKTDSQTDESISQYEKLLGKQLRKESKNLFIIPPYFYSSEFSGWYDVCLKMAKISLKYTNEYNICPIICISKNLISNIFDIEKIKKDYDSFRNLIVWIPDIDEKSSSEYELACIKNFVSLLSAEGNREVFILYGGYYSLLLSKFGLRGFSTSICYGEKKGIDDHTEGGRRIMKYYIPIIMDKVPEIDARAFFEEHFEELCNCQICSKVKNEIEVRNMKDFSISDIDSFFNILKTTFELSKEHFIVVRDNEKEEIFRKSLDDLNSLLTKNIEKCMKLGLERYLSYGHLRRWRRAIFGNQNNAI